MRHFQKRALHGTIKKEKSNWFLGDTKGKKDGRKNKGEGRGRIYYNRGPKQEGRQSSEIGEHPGITNQPGRGLSRAWKKKRGKTEKNITHSYGCVGKGFLIVLFV